MKESEGDPTMTDEGEVGHGRDARARRFAAMTELLPSDIAAPLCANFIGLMGRWVEGLESSDVRMRVILTWGAEYQTALS